MHERGIERADVRWLVAKGIRTRVRSLPGRDPRWSCRGYLGRREATVIIVESRHLIVVVTVEWMDEAASSNE